MKKSVLLAIICCTVLFTSCYKPQQTYNASLSEYSFATSTNETSVKAVLGTIHSLWVGDYAYKGLNLDMSDLKAITRYDESILAIALHENDLEPYFQGNDYFIYTLKRVSGDEVILLQNKFYLDENGNLSYKNIYDYRD